LIEKTDAVVGVHPTTPRLPGGDDEANQRRWVTPMTSVPVLDILLVVLEFVALFVATWIGWFAVVTIYQIVTRKTKSPEN
jgi:hypothetical protein